MRLISTLLVYQKTQTRKKTGRTYTPDDQSKQTILSIDYLESSGSAGMCAEFVCLDWRCRVTVVDKLTS